LSRIRPETRAAYGFLSPWILGFVFFTAGPVAATLVLSMTEYEIFNPPPEWVGLENYRKGVTDPRMHSALTNTAFYTVLYVPASVVLGLAMAMLLRTAGRATGLFRTLIYLPVITPPVATGVMFLLLLNGQEGLINDVLGTFGLPTPFWTTDPDWIKPGLVIMSLWTVGSVTIIFLAALEDVPQSLVDAALVDGANRVQRFFRITMPMISPAILFVVVVNTISSMQMFTEVYTMYFGTVTTNAPDEALMYVIYLFEQGFRFFNMGYAAALAWILFLVIMVLTAVQLKVGGRHVFYRGEK
jgi:multiple sugar transport system permease protein